MKKAGFTLAFVLAVALAALISSNRPGAYHLREFESIKTNFNNYRPSLSDRLRGIRDNQAKWDFHLRNLERLGVVRHTNLIFTAVPYTQESSRHIWRSAYANFPQAVMFTARHYGTNDAGYGANPYVLEVWDFPSNLEHWASFFQTNNHRP